MEDIQFEEFHKIARLSRGCVITEKIDGTNAQVLIVPANTPTIGLDESYVLVRNGAGDIMCAGSRTRYIVPAADNFGFAAWVKAHAAELWTLGPGRHFGEWWGSGVQRGYGLLNGEKRFSLFNVARWDIPERPACVGVVPVLYSGLFTTQAVEDAIARLRSEGSLASPGFMKPEGVVVWHEAARVLFKKTLEKDESPKGRSE